jgi:hypothetical protein
MESTGRHKRWMIEATGEGALLCTEKHEVGSGARALCKTGNGGRRITNSTDVGSASLGKMVSQRAGGRRRSTVLRSRRSIGATVGRQRPAIDFRPNEQRERGRTTLSGGWWLGLWRGRGGRNRGVAGLQKIGWFF